jgi:hypothetical protein
MLKLLSGALGPCIDCPTVAGRAVHHEITWRNAKNGRSQFPASGRLSTVDPFFCELVVSKLSFLSEPFHPSSSGILFDSRTEMKSFQLCGNLTKRFGSRVRIFNGV